MLFPNRNPIAIMWLALVAFVLPVAGWALSSTQLDGRVPKDRCP